MSPSNKGIDERFNITDESECEYCGARIKQVVVDGHSLIIEDKGFHLTDTIKNICFTRGYHSYNDGSRF